MSLLAVSKDAAEIADAIRDSAIGIIIMLGGILFMISLK